MQRMIFLRAVLLSTLVLVGLASAAAGQTTSVRVTKDQSTIWQIGFPVPLVVVKAGTILEAVARQGNWYQVVVPSTDPATRTIGLIAASQVEPMGSARVPERPPAPTGGQRPTRPKPKPGFRAYAIAETERMAASESFAAVLDKSTVTNTGFGVEGTNLWNGVFLRVAATRSSNTGSRVFVDASQKVFSLHVPLTIEMIPIEVGGGWRAFAKPGTPAVPYAGAALLLQRYKETSTPASSDDDIDTTDKGATVFAGIEMSIKFVRIMVEGQYRHIPKTLGAGGVSEQFKETNLGGGALRLGFGVGF